MKEVITVPRTAGTGTGTGKTKTGASRTTGKGKGKTVTSKVAAKDAPTNQDEEVIVNACSHGRYLRVFRINNDR